MKHNLIKRKLELTLPAKKSAFLWGARQTGKSTYLKQSFSNSIYYDLLNTELQLRFEKAPNLFREEVLTYNAAELQYPIIIDEIQKVPALLDEIHWLIENSSAHFILCGSSARKLKSLGSNLLGGRALRFNFYPLISEELPNFDLLRALNNGLIPEHYFAENSECLLESYVIDYLNHEIRMEGIVRNLPDFARFLDAIAFSSGQMVNYTNIARDCGVSARTVESYCQILIDTLIGYTIQPYAKKIRRDLIQKTAKFYFFDVGVANYLARRKLLDLKGTAAGEAFEHFILMELIAYKGLAKKRFDITYWRTKSGLEVDFILGDAKVAIEVKISNSVHKQDIKGLLAFCEEHEVQQAIVVSQDSKARLLNINDKTKIHILPWKDFLAQLWLGHFDYLI